MHEVTELNFGVTCNTRVWLSEKAAREIAKFQKRKDPNKELLKRLKRYAEVGFFNFEGDKCPVQHEWDGVFRVRPTSGLFRMIGFYETDVRANFICLDAFLKIGTQLTKGQIARIDAVAEVKRSGHWRKVDVDRR